MSKDFKFEWIVVKEQKKPAVAPTEAPTMPGAQPAGRRAPFPDTTLVAADELKVSREAMTVGEAQETQDAHDTVATFVDMPLALIEPMAQEAAAATSQAPAISWGIEAIGAHVSPYTGKGVIVAVLDTGIDLDHSAFRDINITTQNFTSEGPGDEDGHGTHCAGTIFGRDVDGKRIGIARGVERALIGKVLGKTSGGSTDTLVKGVRWAQLNGAHVISMSVGIDFTEFQERLVKRHGFPMRRATSVALEGFRLNMDMFNKLSASVLGVPDLVDGSVVVVAAGNESELPNYSIAASLPSIATEFVSVAAISPDKRLAGFSNVGAKLAGPGTAIWSAKPKGGLVALNGTSMATPHVAGAACLWHERLQKTSERAHAKDVIEALEDSALSLEPAIKKREVDWGFVQAPQ